MELLYQLQAKVADAVRRAYKRSRDLQQNRCSAHGHCRYSHMLFGELDEACLRRSLAGIGIQLPLWAGIIRKALS